jgi:iron complex outermembrane receptor protein
LTTNISAYASYSKSFQFQTGVQQVNNVPTGPLSPIIGKGYEGGFKFDFPKSRLSAAVAAFNLDIDGFARNVFVNDPVTGAQLFTTLQDGTQKSRGFEFEGVWEPIAGFQVLGSYSYTDAYYAKVGDPLLLNTQLPGSAHNLWNIWMRKSFTTPSIKGNFFVAGGATYTDKKVTDQGSAASGTFLPSYMTFDVTAGWSRKFGHDRVAGDLSVKNAGNKHYYPSFLTRGEPRQVLVTIKWEH